MIVVLRLCEEISLSVIAQLVNEAEKVLAAETAATGVPAYGESHVERLKAALSRRYFEEGFDPDASLFATLIEERIERIGFLEDE